MIGQYFHTLKYLKANQIFNRIYRRIKRPSRLSESVKSKFRHRAGVWFFCAGGFTPAGFSTYIKPKNEDSFLNPSLPKLLRYKQHYLDELRRGSLPKEEEILAHHSNQEPRDGLEAHEPYALSRRLVNLCIYSLASGNYSANLARRIQQMGHWLSQDLEYHLLGNHLLVNAKALIFAGALLEGEEARNYLQTGLLVIEAQIQEQFLSDGAHFELSPMYHAILLEDFLDLFQCCDLFPDLAELISLRKRLSNHIKSMISWLQTMTHPDGEIALFNDSALGETPSVQTLVQEASRLKIPVGSLPQGGIFLEASGFFVYRHDLMYLIFDCGKIGPDYLPGHAHADTLSIEMSYDSRRVIVDTGTSCYQCGAERNRQRGTMAHNTVAVFGKDSSEVWGEFRVARRAYPEVFEIKKENSGFHIKAAHDGYMRLKKGLIHQREIYVDPQMLTIQDYLQEGVWGISSLHFHPSLKPQITRGLQIAVNSYTMHVSPEAGKWHVEPSRFCSQFGKEESSNVFRNWFEKENKTTVCFERTK